MQIINLDPADTFFMDIIAWILIHLSLGYISARIPISHFDPGKRLYRTFSWEKGGKIYDSVFHVRSWKKFIPGLGKITSNKFSLQKLASSDLDYLKTWLKESCRAEWCHWVMMLPGFFFFLWNSVEVGWWMVAYAVANNSIPIILQRYNRPRIRKMIALLEKHPTMSLMDFASQEKDEKAPAHSYC